MSLALVSPCHLAPVAQNALSQAANTLMESLSKALGDGVSIVARGPAYDEGRLLEALRKAADEDLYVTPAAYERARRFLMAVPDRFPRPEVVVESDGEIGIDWDLGPRKLVSVSVGDGSMLGYAAVSGPNTDHGRVAFAGAFPTVLDFHLRRS